jgi:PEP-CTERM motif
MSKLQTMVERLFLSGSPLSSMFKVALLVGLVPVLLALPFIGRNTEHHRASQWAPVSSRSAPARENLFPAQSVSGLAARPLFPYSVIPGGVESAYELKNAIEHDPVVANHYSDFDVAKTHVIRLDEDRMEYVSYRLGGRVFWTKRELRIRKGETLITDGTHEARTRCGNRLSDRAVQPTSPAQPSPEALESPAAEAAPELFAGNYLPDVIPGSGAPLIPSGPGGPTGAIIPPAYFPIVGGGPPGSEVTPPVGPPVGTPEPSSLILVGIGVGSLWAFARRKKRPA